MKIKICGLNPIRDVQLCINLNVEYLGFVFYDKSPRNVNLVELDNLKKYNKKNSSFVAVSVNPSNDFIKKNIIGNFDYIQLHGNESKNRVYEIKNLGIPFGFKLNAFIKTNPKPNYTGAYKNSKSGNPNEFLGVRKDLTPIKMSEFAKKFRDSGATILGGCCETRPSHIEMFAKLKV